MNTERWAFWWDSDGFNLHRRWEENYGYSWESMSIRLNKKEVQRLLRCLKRKTKRRGEK